ncbi:uncharacterized protein LOC141858598 [Brevipalpus obovatus]|uniref:uncharacterized protein LOC141858598 n=1 Tax=Brevipalpus obovatus TaxID=246614 RepID=UPI003D9F5606
MSSLLDFSVDSPSSENSFSMSKTFASSNVPAFLTKLWKLVSDPKYDHLIHWSENGKSFIIKNQAQFAKDLLPLYFKHNNMASFIRQLNMYGFRKITSIENSGLRADRDEIEFYHHHFVKNQEDLLELIKRKIKTPLQVSSAKASEENASKIDDFSEVLGNIKKLKQRQDTVELVIPSLQRENKELKAQIAILLQKHQKQQRLVDKLIQFILSLVQQRHIGVKRKSPLMIAHDGGHSGAKRMARESGDNGNSLGPLIFDVSDDVIDSEFEDDLDNPIINAVDLSPLSVPREDFVDQNLKANQILSLESIGTGLESVLDPLSTSQEVSNLQKPRETGVITSENTNSDTKTNSAGPSLNQLVNSSVQNDDLSLLALTSNDNSIPDLPLSLTTAAIHDDTIDTDFAVNSQSLPSIQMSSDLQRLSENNEQLSVQDNMNSLVESTTPIMDIDGLREFIESNEDEISELLRWSADCSKNMDINSSIPVSLLDHD